jgi:hypothetical protein
VLVHNRLAKASFAARQALHYEAELNRAMGESAENRLESTTRRMESAGDDLLAALLFVDEAPITAPIAGTSTFAEQFARIGPRDGHGRSLRDFDLQRRLFRHPCSYLIYSPSFQQLPGEMRDYVWRRMGEILTGRDRSERFAHLSDHDRRAIAEILRDTLPELPVWAR